MYTLHSHTHTLFTCTPSTLTLSTCTPGGNHSISEDTLFAIVTQHVCRLKESWPSHPDVLKAFRVFDSEGVGFIKVTLLKRFLVQAQLEVDDSVCEYGQLCR